MPLGLGRLLFGPFDLATASAQVACIPCCLVLGCKALWDGLARNESSALGMKDKRVAIEALVLKRGLSSTSTDLRWVHSLAQLADCMTKDSEQGRTIFLRFARTARWRLVFDPKFLSARKRAAQGLEILAKPPLDDDEGLELREPRNPAVAGALRSSRPTGAREESFPDD